jgi:RNA polymerase sigma factor (sigma-70 family)
MDDSEVVAAIVAGDPAGLGEAYDKYAVPLYAYCRSMLREPADAADAVQDTFLVAAYKLAGLRDPGKLRPWLYAVARNECLRRLRGGNVTFGLDEAAELPGDSIDAAAATEQSDLRELIRDAIDGLNPSERDVIELSLGHALEGDDLAATLGVSRNHAHALLSRARSQFERSLGALIVARTGRHACLALQGMLDGWDGRMTVLMRKRISRHIDHCGICGERKRRELSPAMLAVGAPLAALLPAFREQVLRHCTTRAALSHQFGPTGFPKPLAAHGSSAWRWAAQHSHGVAAGAATSVTAAGVIAAVFVGAAPHRGDPSAAGPDGRRPGATSSYVAGASSLSSPRPGGGDGLAPSASSVATGPTPLVTPAASGTPDPGVTVTPSVTITPGATTAPPAVSSAPATPAVASSSSSADGGGQGTLAISPSAVTLAPGGAGASGSFTITASGGPISHFNITVRSAHELSVAPSSGSLAAGASVTITVTTTSTGPISTWIIVNPGGNKVTVTLS